MEDKLKDLTKEEIIEWITIHKKEIKDLTEINRLTYAFMKAYGEQND